MKKWVAVPKLLARLVFSCGCDYSSKSFANAYMENNERYMVGSGRNRSTVDGNVLIDISASIPSFLDLIFRLCGKFCTFPWCEGPQRIRDVYSIDIFGQI